MNSLVRYLGRLQVVEFEERLSKLEKPAAK